MDSNAYTGAGYNWDVALAAQHPNSPALMRAMRPRTNEAYPRCLVAPAVTGTATVGQTLSCSTGTWLGSPSGYAYQWLRDGVTIASATTSTYVLVSADQTHSISCRVTATNVNGSIVNMSNVVGPVS